MSPQTTRKRVRATRWTVLVAALQGGCGGSPMPQEFWRPWYEQSREAEGEDGAQDGGRASDGGSGADLGSGTAGCRLAVTVTTTAAGGRYAPRNIGAIWISEDGGRFVKTLAVWAEKRAKYLSQWNAATAAAMQPGSRADAISGATKTAHGLRTASWNCRDSAGQPRGDGPYQVCFELTDQDGAGPFHCVPFGKGTQAFRSSPPDVASFTARLLEFQP
jgi:hypothetical protein